MRSTLPRFLRTAMAAVVLSVSTLYAAVSAEELRSLRTGQRIEVTLNSGERLLGNLGSVNQDRFVLLPERKDGTVREMQYSQVERVRTKMTRTTKWTIAGLIYAGLLALGLAVGG